MDLDLSGGGDKAMTFERSLSTWEPMELRYLGDVAGVMQGGSAGGPANGKSVPSPADPGEPNLKPHGQE
jgi:hypothetical protein